MSGDGELQPFLWSNNNKDDHMRADLRPPPLLGPLPP